MNTPRQMEMPFTGVYYVFDADGIFHCKSCKSALFDSVDKFHSGSGWAAFEKCIEDSVVINESSNKRQEITCHSCNSFIGLLFRNEGFTATDKRYEVSSESISFLPRLGVE